MNQNSPLFVAISNSYTHLEFALYKGTLCLDYAQTENKNSSRLFIPLFNELLEKNHLSCSDLSFLAVNTGPGPFSTLRTVVASVNGIAFACQIPLVGVDGLIALVDEQSPTIPDTDILVVLLNAFNNEVYYALVVDSKVIEKGYKKIDTLTSSLAQYKNQTIHCVGNGALLHAQALTALYGARIKIPNPCRATCSIQQIAYTGLHQWQSSSTQNTELHIAYLKSRAW